ncbi:CCHC-type domain-containing protein [Trichonephila inaurata madagascariensis]|uniref:CCHC-type domain-containing protein n=1 Tax=Trichonephila inaurata madagascariensis TaxID=2747483 RepID=A0A8X6Y7Y3_9ARAC|nr:CCHC-type domain-containing protein [Trichonephila inaurata madagascariensis]
MAFLGKGLKADLQVMATEMGVEDILGLKVFVCNWRREKKKRRDGIGGEKKKSRTKNGRKEETGRGRGEEEEMDFVLQKRQIELKGEGNANKVKEPGQFKIDAILDERVDSGVQMSVVQADLVKDIKNTGEGKIKLVSAFGESEITLLRTCNIKIDDGWHDAVPITCAVSKKLVNDMLVCQTAYEAILENMVMQCECKASH